MFKPFAEPNPERDFSYFAAALTLTKKGIDFRAIAWKIIYYFVCLETVVVNQ